MICHVAKNIYAGDIDGANNLELLKKEGISVVISLTEIEIKEDVDIVYVKIPIVDPDVDENLFHSEIPKMDMNSLKEKLRIASEVVSMFLHGREENVLVHCLGCMDRTPAVLALALKNVMIEDEGVTLDSIEEAYDFVRQKVPTTFQHWDWVREE